MRRQMLWLSLLINGCCTSTLSLAQDFDGACLLVTQNMQWSGVAISPTEILTVAHHGLSVGSEIQADFPEHKHGGSTRVSLKARVKKINKRADICLLEYKAPEWACIKQYRVPVENPLTTRGRKVRIHGYVNHQPMFIEPEFERGDVYVTGAEDIAVNQFIAQAVEGMSGSPILIGDTLVGIQFGGGKKDLHAASVKTIQEFLK